MGRVRWSDYFPVTSNAVQTTLPSDDETIAIVKINEDLSSLLYSSLFGGSSGDYGYELYVAPDTCLINVLSVSYSDDFPITSSAFQTTKTTNQMSPVVSRFILCPDTFDIKDTNICAPNFYVHAPVLGGTWWNGSQADSILINSTGTFWYSVDLGCEIFATMTCSSISPHMMFPF